MQYLNNIKTSCKDFLNVFSTFENLVKTESVKSVCKHGMMETMEVETNVSNYFENDEYEHIRPIARLFRKN